MFKEGNLVRLITEDGDSEIMSVKWNQKHGTETVACEKEEPDEDPTWFDVSDLELVTVNITETESTPTRANVNSMDEDKILEELNKLIIYTITSMRDKGCEERITINIACEHYSSSDTVDVKYGVRIRFNDMVESNSLSKSASTAWYREQEDERLKVKAIPFRVAAKL